MSGLIRVDIRGLDGVQKLLKAMPEAAEKALPLALNRAILFGAAETSRKVRKDLNLNQTYIGPVTSSGSRIFVSKKASPTSLEAIITVPGKPTNLGRYATGAPRLGRSKSRPKVKVKKGGGSQTIRNGFYVPIGKRNKDNEPGAVGIVVRVKDGATLNKRELPGKSFGPNLYLLYGPDVYQSAEIAADDVLTSLVDVAETEFYRQFARLNK